MKVERRLLGVFTSIDQVRAAVRALQEDDTCTIEVFSPVPEHHLLEESPKRWRGVPYFTLVGAALGLVSGFALAAGTAMYHDLWLSGMAPVSYIPFVVVGFEVTVLFGGLATMAGLALGARWPRFREPKLWDTRLSEDCFGIGVDCIEDYVDRLAATLEAHGAEDVLRA